MLYGFSKICTDACIRTGFCFPGYSYELFKAEVFGGVSVSQAMPGEFPVGWECGLIFKNMFWPGDGLEISISQNISPVLEHLPLKNGIVFHIKLTFLFGAQEDLLWLKYGKKDSE